MLQFHSQTTLELRQFTPKADPQHRYKRLTPEASQCCHIHSVAPQHPPLANLSATAFGDLALLAAADSRSSDIFSPAEQQQHWPQLSWLTEGHSPATKALRQSLAHMQHTEMLLQSRTRTCGPCANSRVRHTW